MNGSIGPPELQRRNSLSGQWYCCPVLSAYAKCGTELRYAVLAAYAKSGTELAYAVLAVWY
eukprot:3660253-Rhodomonas_salina.3